MGTFLVIIVAFLLAAVFIVLELFIPSHGLLALLAAACLILGIYKCYLVSNLLGVVVAVLILVSLPFLILVMVRVWPDTWIGRRIAIKKAEQAQPGQSIPDAQKLDKLLGQVGQAATDLRPVGAVMFGTQRVDCVAQTGQILKGSQVKVVRVEGVRVVVRENV